MKHPTGSVRPRRLAVPKTPVPRKKVRLDLKRRPEPEPESQVAVEKGSNFWKWVLFVGLLHILVIGVVCFIYQMTPAPKPPEQFISLLPEGDVVKGTPGAPAHKVGPTTAVPTHHHTTASKPPTPATPPKPAAVTPPKPLMPPPTIQPPPPSQPSPTAIEKPAPTPPPKPTPPKPTPPKPKVKVDLTLADAPDADKPVTKPKPHLKKPVEKPSEATRDAESAESSDSQGPSKEQIAAKLDEKQDPAGVRTALNAGISGQVNAHSANNFSEFYASIRDQVMSQWQSPNLSDETAVNPIVQIHVERDGGVPPEYVRLLQSSGNTSYDESALSAAKTLGHLHEPLPEGCPPDIPITFKLTR